MTNPYDIQFRIRSLRQALKRSPISLHSFFHLLGIEPDATRTNLDCTVVAGHKQANDHPDEACESLIDIFHVNDSQECELLYRG